MPIVVLILAITSILDIGPTPNYVPLEEEAYTLDLEADGYVNGAMDKARLMTVEGCTLERDAAYMYALMMEAAEQDGVRFGWEDCYRSYNMQKASYNRRCPYTEVPVFDTDPLTGQSWQVGSKAVRVCSGPPTARPGFSNHGWGRAADLTDGRGVLTCSDREFLWLQANAYRFGWVNPRWAWCDRSTREPWHWEYAGVADPTLVNPNPLNADLLAVVE